MDLSLHIGVKISRQMWTFQDLASTGFEPATSFHQSGRLNRLATSARLYVDCYSGVIRTQIIQISEVDFIVVLLFKHSAKSLNAQEECLATSPLLVTRLHLPHAIVVRLHAH